MAFNIHNREDGFFNGPRGDFDLAERDMIYDLAIGLGFALLLLAVAVAFTLALVSFKIWVLYVRRTYQSVRHATGLPQ